MKGTNTLFIYTLVKGLDNSEVETTVTHKLVECTSIV